MQQVRSHEKPTCQKPMKLSMFDKTSFSTSLFLKQILMDIRLPLVVLQMHIKFCWSWFVDHFCLFLNSFRENIYALYVMLVVVKAITSIKYWLFWFFYIYVCVCILTPPRELPALLPGDSNPQPQGWRWRMVTIEQSSLVDCFDCGPLVSLI